MASRPVEHIEDEVRRLVDSGYREMVLTGIHLGHYGVEWNRGRAKHEWTRLSHLVDRLARLPGDFRIRLSSIEATEVTRELIAVIAEHGDKVCPHLHISMQSGSDEVLRRMRRRWGAQRFVDRCRMVKESLDMPALTTDVIVGFPGETDADFAATCRVCEEVGFSKIHIFPFSPRRTTTAAEMPEQIAPIVKSDRVNRLTELEQSLRYRYYRQLIGRSLRVLIESPEHYPQTIGTSCRYAPVVIARPTDSEGFVDALANAVNDGRLLAC